MNKIVLNEIRKYLGSIPGREGHTFVIKQVNRYKVVKIQGKYEQSVLQYNIYIEDTNDELKFSSVCNVIYRNDRDKAFDNKADAKNEVKVGSLIETNNIKFICINSVEIGGAEKPTFLETYRQYMNNDFSYMEIAERAAVLTISEYIDTTRVDLPVHFVRQELDMKLSDGLTVKMPWCLPAVLASNLTDTGNAEDIAKVICGTTWGCVELKGVNNKRVLKALELDKPVDKSNYVKILGEYAHYFTSQHCIQGIGEAGLRDTLKLFIQHCMGYNSNVLTTSLGFNRMIQEVEAGNKIILFLDRDKDTEGLPDARHVISLKSYNKETQDLWFMDSNGGYDNREEPGGNHRVLIHFEDTSIPFDVIYNSFINYYKVAQILMIQPSKVKAYSTEEYSIEKVGIVGINNQGLVRNIDKHTNYWNNVEQKSNISSIDYSMMCTLAMVIRAMESEYSLIGELSKIITITPFDIYKTYELGNNSGVISNDAQLIYSILRMRRYNASYNSTKTIEEIKSDLDNYKYMILVYNRYTSKILNGKPVRDELKGIYTLFIAGYDEDNLIAYTISTEGRIEKLLIPSKEDRYRTIIIDKYICVYAKTISNITSLPVY